MVEDSAKLATKRGEKKKRVSGEALYCLRKETGRTGEKKCPADSATFSSEKGVTHP